MEATNNYRKKYHSHIVWLYNQNKEHVLPFAFRKSIPYSNASTWRNTDFNTYFGNEYDYIQKEALEYFEFFEEYKRLKRVVRTFSKVWVSISKCITPVLQKNKNNTELFINSIQQLSTVVSLSMACRIFSISKATFHYRITELKYACDTSSLSMCFKRHPLQLSINEVEKIKEAFTSPAYTCWPAISIYFKLLREKQLNISKSTFYKYVRILGLQRKWAKPSRKTDGIVSSKVNEYIHVDTTYWELHNGVKAGIVFVSDNYSRAILSWSVTLGNSSKNVLIALKNAIDTIQHFHPEHSCIVELVADGGSENHARNITEFLETCKNPPIHKIIAKKDIVFSNSPIEAINKINFVATFGGVKRYLRFYKPGTLEKVNALLPLIKHDYMELRPHGSLNGLTPLEVYSLKKPTFDFPTQISQARSLRIEQNKRSGCEIYISKNKRPSSQC